MNSNDLFSLDNPPLKAYDFSIFKFSPYEERHYEEHCDQLSEKVDEQMQIENGDMYGPPKYQIYSEEDTLQTQSAYNANFNISSIPCYSVLSAGNSFNYTSFQKNLLNDVSPDTKNSNSISLQAFTKINNLVKLHLSNMSGDEFPPLENCMSDLNLNENNHQTVYNHEKPSHISNEEDKDLTKEKRKLIEKPYTEYSTLTIPQGNQLLTNRCINLKSKEETKKGKGKGKGKEKGKGKGNKKHTSSNYNTSFNQIIENLRSYLEGRNLVFEKDTGNYLSEGKKRKTVARSLNLKIKYMDLAQLTFFKYFTYDGPKIPLSQFKDKTFYSFQSYVDSNLCLKNETQTISNEELVQFKLQKSKNKIQTPEAWKAIYDYLGIDQDLQ